MYAQNLKGRQHRRLFHEVDGGDHRHRQKPAGV